MYVDKEYNLSDIRITIAEYGYTGHIKNRGEENIERDIRF
jgi:hypothetical protein